MRSETAAMTTNRKLASDASRELRTQTSKKEKEVAVSALAQAPWKGRRPRRKWRLDKRGRHQTDRVHGALLQRPRRAPSFPITDTRSISRRPVEWGLAFSARLREFKSKSAWVELLNRFQLPAVIRRIHCPEDWHVRSKEMSNQ